eukprot:CAMPEP_0183296728 /NCGR_PEP_ID=MMETSP0160_2-20130417/4168_1 /TAXON_ID=2839 ORGANISM="Odontella Sinensis, Strain Grunow 1884" /NCGR_SAMPLE_ID=MMETSP0160_2 /ASSEMBLY_ACC=CAM_ASM_000250 /LENGTH=83 /DNA_ID=CAMNT_0025458389 /DNA_START=100 /DNA_END=351 /DNA_ORIENTATION=-
MFKSVVVLAAIAASASAFAPSSRAFGVKSSLSAEDWSPAEGMKWEEKDWESKLDKLQKEAEERLDDKIDDLMRNIATSGAKEE